MTLKRFLISAIALATCTGLAAPAIPQAFRGGEQDSARRKMLEGDVMPFSIIKRRVEQEMRGEAGYVGVAPSPRDGVYRMQFLRRDGRVIWVDVDGKTGDIIARTR